MKIALFCLGLLGCLSALLPDHAFAQGPLAPPGPPGPVMKTLQQVEPRTPISSLPLTITNSGSYYLTGNLTAPGTNGVTVATNDVSLDLNGFVLDGRGGGGGGVRVSGVRTNVAVFNGAVAHWPGVGVDASSGRGVYLERLRVVNNGSDGIGSGNNSIVQNCIVLGNGGVGIRGGGANRIKDCVVNGNGTHGIVADQSTIINCEAGLNGGNGIDAVSESSVIGCRAKGNGTNGVVAFEATLIRDCTLAENVGDGILVRNRCIVLNNNCRQNGFGSGDGAGIRVLNDYNRIEGNNVTTNDRGIDVAQGGNLIIKNSAGGNGTNYVIVGTQSIGPIITATGTITTNNPWANFEF